jgi:hypothetical protein
MIYETHYHTLIIRTGPEFTRFSLSRGKGLTHRFTYDPIHVPTPSEGNINENMLLH